ncbi:GNAT family N-acetyltransferase, partial [Vibrio vulnificus]
YKMSIQGIVSSTWSDILQLQQGVYLSVEPESLEVLQSKWLRSPETCFVFNEDSQVMGYLLAHSWNTEIPPKLFKPLPSNTEGSILFLHDLAVRKSESGKGIGKKLIAQLLKTAHLQGYEQILLVAVQNSVNFWKKQGFIPLNQKVKECYGEGAQLMRRVLVA